MGILLSWPVIAAVLIAIAIKTGYSRKLYYAALGTDLRAVSKDEYDLFMHCYTGQLTYEAIGKHIEQYTDLLGKVRATISLNEETLPITYPVTGGDAMLTEILDRVTASSYSCHGVILSKELIPLLW